MNFYIDYNKLKKWIILGDYYKRNNRAKEGETKRSMGHGA